MKRGGELPKGLTEFTNSESKLERVLALSYMLMDGPKTPEVLAKRAGRELGITSLDVLGRHLRLGERLGLLQRSGSLLNSTDAARALRSLDSNRPVTAGGLSPYDKLALAMWLFREADYQLMTLVAVIGASIDAHPASVTVSYFGSTPNLPWPREGIDRNLRAFRASARTPRLWEHKVTAMVAWLRSLGLVKPTGVYALTDSGRYALKLWQEGTRTFRRSPLRVAAVSTGLSLRDSTPEAPWPDWLVGDISQRILASRGTLGMISYEYVWLASTLSLVVEKGIVLEADDFYDIVKSLWKAGVLRSILMGRQGRPVALTVS